ncbi:STAS domain-containing protein [Streptomyces sp. S.PB5]|uniref:STAS domain-containing protein n=1 Tax=Streptomyces sp. S.PB5 TaxID=3020844 RepID=UPI0025B15C7E|nr:STAS domain-containing protein [Streptomyces sp. S.PB5]MDN3028972.1 STAS domain-containing protein [Streptomyces sp. S.PB5]
MSPWQDFCSIVERREGAAVVIELHGEFDICAAAPLRACLRELTRDRDQDVIVDLRSATFVDAAILGVLCGANNRLRGNGHRLQVVATRPLIVKILELCRLDQVLHLVNSLPAHSGSTVSRSAQGV